MAGPRRRRRRGSAAWRRRRGAGARRGYDLAINFEGDIRSHALIALAGARRRVGFAMAGGGPLLTDVVDHRVDRHTADNAAALVAAAFRSPGLNPGLNPRQSPGAEPRLAVSGSTCRMPRGSAARDLVGSHPRYVVVHASGGRAIKQWDVDRFAAATTHDRPRARAPPSC